MRRDENVEYEIMKFLGDCETVFCFRRKIFDALPETPKERVVASLLHLEDLGWIEIDRRGAVMPTQYLNRLTAKGCQRLKSIETFGLRMPE